MATPRTSKVIDSPTIDVPKPSDITFDSVYVPDEPEIIAVPAPSGGAGDSKQFEELRFNEEFVEVMVHESTDKNAENPVFTGCNEITQYFFRGQVQKVKRKYLAILASCKEHSIRTVEYTQPDGSRATKIVRTSSLKYPFSVISDPNPRGAPWLRALLASAT
jgi:hypothetical protein